jgi:hypothetical protein
MAVRSVLVASNYWHKPGITVTFRHDADAPSGSVHVEIPIDDLLLAIAAEMPSGMKMLTKAKVQEALRAAYAVALEKVKEATNKAL